MSGPGPRSSHRADPVAGGVRSPGSAPGTYAVVAVLLAAALVALLWLPSYAKITPTFEGIPFFYWYSMLWVAINAVLQIIAYRLLVGGRRSAR